MNPSGRVTQTLSLSRLESLNWGWTLNPLRSRKDVKERIRHAIEMEKKNQEYVFAVILRQEDRVVGGTSYFGISPRHKRLEIG